VEVAYGIEDSDQDSKYPLEHLTDTTKSPALAIDDIPAMRQATE
jgi:hypothetical protein